MPNTRVLTVSHLDYSYRNSRVLDDISFGVTRNQICGLLGPNGSGKTTLLKSINGILTQKKGCIRVNGQNINRLDRPSIAKIMAVVPQETGAVFPFTVLQMVVMGGTSRYGLFGKPGKRDYRHALDILEEMGIAALADRMFTELSGGEKQMVLIARALFQNPVILLLDEPTSHLDFKKQHHVMQTIRRITVEKNLATLVTLHDPNLAGRYCDSLIMIRQGRIIYEGLRQSVFTADSLNATYDIAVRIECACDGTQFVLAGECTECG